MIHIPPGLYIVLDEAKYRQDPALSKSKLDLIKKSPAHFLYYESRNLPETTAMIFGRCLHLALLEPKRFQNEVIGVGAGRASKSFKEAVEANKPRTTITLDEFETINDMCAAVNSHEKANALLTNNFNLREASIFFEYEGLSFKSRIDVLNLEDKFAIDIKSSSDASRSGFLQSVERYGYHRQAALYLDAAKSIGHEIKEFIFIVIEKEPPFGVGVYELDKTWIEVGRKELKALINSYKDCMQKRNWPSYTNNEIEILECPFRVFDKFQEREDKLVIW